MAILSLLAVNSFLEVLSYNCLPCCTFYYVALGDQLETAVAKTRTQSMEIDQYREQIR